MVCFGDVCFGIRWSHDPGYPGFVAFTMAFPMASPQQFLDGEKLVDGMLRRIRSAATQAGRDPDERRGGTVELALSDPIAMGLWDMENWWMMDASNLSH